MKLTLAVDLGEGPVEVTSNLYVIVQYERKYKRKASDMANGVGMEDLLFIAYESCKLHGVTVPVVFDDFIKKAISVEVVDQDTDANPTLAAPTDIY
jgi:hypothetical protein